MKKNKSTAVEWLFNQMPEHLTSTINGFDMLQQAKDQDEDDKAEIAILFADWAKVNALLDFPEEGKAYLIGTGKEKVFATKKALFDYWYKKIYQKK